MSSSSIVRQPSDHPPRPRAVLRVGVTGYRPRKAFEIDTPAIRGRVREALTIIRDTVARVAAHPAYGYRHDWEVRVVSALAEGADRIVAEEALALHCTLEAPLPFSVAEYRRDFKSSESKDGFDALVQQATSILALDGERESSGEYGTPSTYGAVGLVIVQNCDVVLAIWDGEEPERIGGVAHVVSMAALYDLPLIRIDPTDSDNSIEVREADGGVYVRHFPLDAITRKIAELLGPARELQPQGESAPVVEGRAHRTSGLSDLREEFFSETPPRHAPSYDSFDILVRWLGGTTPVVPMQPAVDFVAAEREEWSRHWHPIDDASPATREHIAGALVEPYAWADRLAVNYAKLYRSSYSWLYGLAFLSIVWAMCGFGIPAWLMDSPRWELVRAAGLGDAVEHSIVGVADFLRVAFALLGLVTLLAIWWIYRWNRRARTHEKWIDYRSLAELLRHHRFLLPLGRTSGLMAVPDRRGFPDAASDWADWYARAMVRDAGLTPAVMSPGYLHACKAVLTEYELSGQARYHESTHRRFDHAFERLHKAANLLFVFALVGVVVELGLHLFFHAESRLATVLAVLCPAAASAIHGFLSQADLNSIALRASRIRERLLRHREELQHIAAPTSFALGTVAEASATVMAGELSDWRGGARARPIPLAF